MRLEFIVTTAVLLAIGSTAPVKAQSPAYAAQLLENKQCQKCDPVGADVKDARQERREQRQQLRDARQDVTQQRQQLQDARQDVREQRQQLRDIPQDARQERREQRQELQDARQERTEQRQQLQDARQDVTQQQQQLRDVRQYVPQEVREQRQQLQDARQERTQQRQQLQDARQDVREEQQQLRNIPQDARQERREQRQELQDARQERTEQRQELQDARQDVREQRQQLQDARQDVREQRQQRRDTWWLWEPNAWQYQPWWEPNAWQYQPWWESNAWQYQPWWESNAWQYQPWSYVYPAPTVSSIRVDFISLTNDRVTVLIEGVDGRQELVFYDRQTKQTVYLPPGTYKLWFKDSQGSPWISGTLNLGQTNQLRIGFDKDKKLLQVYDDPYAWIEDRYSSNRVYGVERIPVEYPEIANEGVDTSFCYMQTQDGKTLNLSSLCDNPAYK